MIRPVGIFLGIALSAASLHAQPPLHDPSLPSVGAAALEQLSDSRVRQEVMLQSQARYAGRCVCPYLTQDLNGRSCKGRHEIIKTHPSPICYPSQVTSEMVDAWRKHHSGSSGQAQ